MPDHDATDLRPAPPRGAPAWIYAVLIACAAAAVAAWWFWLRPAVPVADLPPPQVAAPPAPAPAQAASAPEPAASGPLHRVDALAPADAALPPLAASDAHVAALLGELLGADRVARFLATEGFVRRVVATVDNFGRAQAPPRMWPVQPTPGRFEVLESPAAGDGGVQVVAPGNPARYAGALALAEAVPLDAVVALYARLYPLFQQAYEELGYPGRYFNDRLVAVLDHLLLAPQVQGPLRVRLLPVNTAVADPRPWVRYEFADPALQSLSSGQKILVRMGPEAAARAKALIRELRKRVATGVPAQPEQR